MSDINWPPSIPTPLIEGFSYQNSEQVALHEMSNGPPIARLLSQNAYSRFEVSWLLCGLQKRLFTAFFDLSLEYGSKWFNIELNIDFEPVLHTCLMQNPTYTRKGTHWRVTTTLISDINKNPECCDVLNTIISSSLLQTASLDDFKQFVEEDIDPVINPVFGQVQLQLSMDGPQNANTPADIIDHSLNAHVPASVGGFLFEGQKKFGQASYAGALNERIVYDNASGLPFVIPDENYCIECFIFVDSSVGTPIITSLGEGSTPQLEFGLAQQDSQHFLTVLKVGSDIEPVTSAPLPYDAWIHVALCRDGTTVRLFQNGFQIAATSDFGDYGDPDNDFFFIGGSNSGNQRMLIDEYRLTVGPQANIYTTDFTPPTGPFPRQ